MIYPIGSDEPRDPKYNDDPGYEDDPDYEDERVECPSCHGSGLEWEGWDCEYCEGYGFLDI
jgi:hypothetical protein